MKKKSISLVLIVILVMGIHMYLTTLTPLFADDYTYMYSFADGFDSATRDTVVTDADSLLQSQIGHYYCMNGRVVSHTFVQFFLMLPKMFFNIANAFLFAMLGLLICFHAFGKWRSIKPIDLLLTYTALLLLAPTFGQSYLWLTGACNYLLTFVIVLLFLIPYRTNWSDTKGHNAFLSLLPVLPMLAFGAIAGNTNENIGISLAVVLLVYIVAYILYNRKIKIWMISGWIGTVTGFVFSVMSPGNVIRTGGSPLQTSITSIVKFALFYTADMVQRFAPLIIGLVIALGIILLIKSRKGKVSVKLMLSSLRNNFFLYFYGLFFLGSVYAMTVPAQFPDRAWSHPLALLIIVFLIVARKGISALELKHNERRCFSIVGSALLIVALGLGYCSALPELRRINIAHNDRVAMIQEAKANNQTEVAIPTIISTSRYACYDHLGDILKDPDHWVNEVMAKYYGIDTIYQSEDTVS